MKQDFFDFLRYKINITEKVGFSVQTLLILIIALLFTGYILKLIRKIITHRLPETDKNKFESIFQFVKYIIYIFIVMFTLHTSGANISVFLTASAALFVGLGFALQTFFQDIISGMLMILDQSLHVGDIIEVEGKVGIVKEIKLRTTRVVTRNDRVMIIPNHKFMSDILFNWTQNGEINREQIAIGVAYGSDVELVKEKLLECATKVNGVLKTPKPVVFFEDFADSSLNFSLYFYVNEGMKSPRIKSDLRFKINQTFKENNISIPFPQRDIHILQ